MDRHEMAICTDDRSFPLTIWIDPCSETTGNRVWESARFLVAFLLEQREQFFAQPHCRALELGAGTGYVSLALAAVLGECGVRITATDRADGLPQLQKNVAESAEACVDVRELDWANSDTYMADEPFDVIVGSDLAYNELGVEFLPKVWRAHMGSGTRVLYAHMLHRFDIFDNELFDSVVRNGLDYRELRFAAKDEFANAQNALRRSSAGPCLTSFGSGRCAVFEIFRTNDVAKHPRSYLPWPPKARK